MSEEGLNKALARRCRPRYLCATMKTPLILIVSHLVVLGLGFALGIYALPILTAPTAPTPDEASLAAREAVYAGQFRRDLAGSDLLHWGEGTVSVGRQNIVFTGELAPGPDYKLYLSPEFVDTEADFLRLKSRMVRVGDVRTFDNFVVPVPATIDVSDYAAAIIWCESFDQFITAAAYRE
jgi:hypothetical protein